MATLRQELQKAYENEAAHVLNAKKDDMKFQPYSDKLIPAPQRMRRGSQPLPYVHSCENYKPNAIEEKDKLPIYQPPLVPEALLAKLFPHQLTAFHWLTWRETEHNNDRVRLCPWLLIRFSTYLYRLFSLISNIFQLFIFLF